MEATAEARRQRAQQSLEGLSVGDAFGESYFVASSAVSRLVADRTLLDPPWHWTDDTHMALSIYSCLRLHDGIDRDWLAAAFARRYEPGRGYGPAMHGLLHAVRHGEPWRRAAAALFGGQGSFGNGAAMRVAPLGAYFADDLDAAVEHARLSAEVTHAHPEAAAGAIAVAVAAALACRVAAGSTTPPEFLDQVLPHVPAGEVRTGIEQARKLPTIADGASVRLAAAVLGDGSAVSAQDTLPFVLWCAAQSLDDYEEALWLTVGGLGDRDTTCAMVGGIVAARLGAEAIPAAWREAREALPDWPFLE